MELCQIVKALWQESWKEAGIADVILWRKILKGMHTEWCRCTETRLHSGFFTGYTILEGRWLKAMSLHI